MTSQPTTHASKEEWRRWARTIDRAQASDAVSSRLGAWPPLYGVVASYLAMPHEVDVSAATDRPTCSVVVPRTEPDDHLTLHHLDPRRLTMHRYGFAEPDRSSDPLDRDAVDVVLVPGLVFDRRGHRLGHGAGMYDRLLGTLPTGVVRVGVTTESTLVDELPTGAHDQPVDWIVSEAGVVRTGSELPATSQRVVEAAEAVGVAAAMVRYPAGTKTSHDAAAAVGSELGSIAKSLVFLVDDEPILVICSGDRRVDPDRLTTVVGGSVAAPAPLDRVRAITGFVAGGTPAFGHATPLPVLADTGLARYRWVWSAGGTPDTVYPVALDRLIAASGARWVDIAVRG